MSNYYFSNSVADERLFVEYVDEYVRRDMNYADTQIRRNAIHQFLRKLSERFEATVFEFFGLYVEELLFKYSQNTEENWREKCTAIFLVSCLSTQGFTRKRGVTKSTSFIPLDKFCIDHIIPELADDNTNHLPILKADAIKFALTFRSILNSEIIFACVPYITRHLGSGSEIVRIYASLAIRKMPIVPKMIAVLPVIFCLFVYLEYYYIFVNNIN